MTQNWCENCGEEAATLKNARWIGAYGDVYFIPACQPCHAQLEAEFSEEISS